MEAAAHVARGGKAAAEEAVAPLWEPDHETEVRAPRRVRVARTVGVGSLLHTLLCFCDDCWHRYLSTRLWCTCIRGQVCKVCQVKFTTFKRRHHCRQCGACVCSLCSAFEWILPHISASKLCRICRTCYFELVKDRRTSDGNRGGTPLVKGKAAGTNRFWRVFYP